MASRVPTCFIELDHGWTTAGEESSDDDASVAVPPVPSVQVPSAQAPSNPSPPNPSTMALPSEEALVVPFDLYVGGSRFEREDLSTYDAFDVEVVIMYADTWTPKGRRRVECRIRDVKQVWVDIGWPWGIHYVINVFVPPEEATTMIDLAFLMKIHCKEETKCVKTDELLNVANATSSSLSTIFGNAKSR